MAACLLAVIAVAPKAEAAVRDDTESLQAKLDEGGNVFLPKRPDGRCYATRGLWVSRDGTSITSDGACCPTSTASRWPTGCADGDPDFEPREREH